jgi:SpoIID/LytB domain protein
MSSSRSLAPILASLLIALPWLASGEDLARVDQLRFLYSGQMSFTADGLPVVPVGIMDRKKEVTLSAPEGVRVLPDGEGGPEVRAAGSWTVRVEGGRPAKLRWSVVLEKLVGKKRSGVSEALEAWRSRGEKPRVIEIGSLFGVRGTVLDRRAALLLSEPLASEKAARELGEEIAKRWKVDAQAYEEIVELPRGTLVATSGTGATPVEVRNNGVLWFASERDGTRLTVAQVEFGGVGAQAHTGREDRGYFGKIYVTLDVRGQLAVVNAVPATQLLAGLVPAEMFPKAPAEALKAQAVAARTELLAKLGSRHRTDPYRVCSTQHCQVYAGAGKENPRSTAAVEKTRGEVLFRPDAEDLMDAYYSASCGGFSEHNDNVWPEGGPDPALRGHLDALEPDARFSGGLRTDALLRSFLTGAAATHCGTSSYNRERYRWTVKRTAAELDKLLAPLGVGRVRELVLGERGVSGRLRSITVRGDRGDKTVRGDLKIRQTLGNLRSAMFAVDQKPGEWTFSGAGFGHGVGMCQTGAIGMAEQGLDYRAILSHYYTGSRIHTLY